AFATTGAPPDDALLELAAQGQLRDASVRAEQAERLLSTPGAAALIGDFATQWLEARELPTTARDAALDPDFDVVKLSAATELRDFVARAILDEGASYSELLLADWTVADDVMATFYGVDTAGRITRPEGRAAGVLALPGFLAAHAQFQDPSPVQRGH